MFVMRASLGSREVTSLRLFRCLSAMLRSVRARHQLIFAVLLLTLCLGAPVLETFDRWDHTLQDGNDTETNLVVVGLCVAVGFIVAARVLRRVRPLPTGTFVRSTLCACASPTDVPLAVPNAHASPPTILRV
jgi:hypothetical protein